MTHVGWNLIYVQLWSYACIHAQQTELQSGVRLFIMPGMPTQLVPESNVDTVLYSSHTQYNI